MIPWTTQNLILQNDVEPRTIEIPGLCSPSNDFIFKRYFHSCLIKPLKSSQFDFHNILHRLDRQFRCSKIAQENSYPGLPNSPLELQNNPLDIETKGAILEFRGALLQTRGATLPGGYFAAQNLTVQPVHIYHFSPTCFY